MTPDTRRLDLRFAGVGRIAKASGTHSPQVLAKLKRMCRALYQEGRLDILRAVRDGVVTPLEVYDAYIRRALADLPIGEMMPMLDATLERWINDSESDYSTNHVANLKTARRHFKKAMPTARVGDLPKVLEKLRTSFGKKHPRSFNYLRAAALAFVRATLKKSHPLWHSCSAVEPRKVLKGKLREPLDPKRFVELFPNPTTDRVDAIAWSMVTTGMGSREYWGAWHVETDRVHIHGTKREGRVRDVPLVRAPSTPRLSRDRFEKLFRKRSSGITPYDLRRCYVRWLEAAGVSRTRRRLYMGHGAGDVTDLYERAEIAAFLLDDAKRMQAYLGPQFTPKPLAIAK